MRKKGKCMAVILAASLAVSAAFAGSGTTAEAAGKSTEFTCLTTTAIDGTYYDDYDDNPAAQYWLSHEWDADGDGEGTTISIDFWSPTAGAETDYVTTLISTGEYPDFLSLNASNESAMKLYDEGIALDITEYVEKYMPNYVACMEAHPEYHYTNVIDGEEKYIQIYGVSDVPGDRWGGYLYRRDWIVKYGTNPEGGAAFSGEWVDGEWVDDVVFPSGNTDPITITDWEWMMGIFDTAMEALGITDGYAMQLPYMGIFGTGDLVTGFGGIGDTLYYDENGDIALGTTSDGFHAYVDCMTAWYENGWIDPAFAERAGEPFYMIDAASVYSGKVGIWYGLISQMLGGLDPGDGSNPWLDGAVVFSAPSPINDKYGDASVQNKEPRVYYADALISYAGFVVTDKAEDKDIATLLTAIDYLYSEEGGLVCSRGLSKEMLDAAPDSSYTQTYQEWGLENGAFTMDGDTVVVDPVINADTDVLGVVVCCNRTAGKIVNDNIDKGHSDTKKRLLDLWGCYGNSGSIYTDLTSQLDSDASSDYKAFNSELTTVVAQWVPQFITGQLDIRSDGDWQSFVDEVNALNPQETIDALQQIVDVLK